MPEELVAGLRRFVRRRPTLRSRVMAARRVIAPLREQSVVSSLVRYPGYVSEYRKYSELGGKVRPRDVYPRLHDRTASQGIDPHYFHQAAWAMSRVRTTSPPSHVDVGSETGFVGMLTALTDVCYVDIRPIGVTLPRFTEIPGSVLALPMLDRSVVSISCLHVAEHIGLGRYGDPLDPAGTTKAAKELQRVLAPGGSLFLSLPIGRARVEFNAHRVHPARAVTGMFPELELRELSVVSDDGRLHLDAGVDEWDDQDYACGMFWFTRPLAS